MAKGGGGGQPPPSGGGGGGGDNSTNFVWMIAGIVIASGLAWSFGRAYIVATVFKVRTLEIQLVEAFLFTLDKISSYVGLNLTIGVSLEKWRVFINNNIADAGNIPFSYLVEVSTGVGRYLSYPAALILILLAAYLFFTNVGTKYKTIFSMKYLRQLEVLNWPQLNPLMDTDLIETPIDEGPWAISTPPMMFARKNKLVEEITKKNRPALKLIHGKTHQLFALQMGPYWEGLEKLPKYIQALFAIFAAHGNNDVDSAQKMLRQISLSATPGGKLNFSGVRPLLVKHVRKRSIGRVVGMHAYVYTIMISMLELARTGGVVASADFLWLKLVDRRLWYVLSTVGRQTAFCEAAGPYAHWLVERRLRRPLKTPMVKEAIIGLQTAIDDIKFNPDEM